MTLTEYLAGMASAQTADELEAAIQADHSHPFIGPKWSRICKVRIQAGERICRDHPLGQFVPIVGPRRLLEVCGETYRVGCGQNSTGVRYVWHYAMEWTVEVLMRHGLSRRAAHRVWDPVGSYPHRCLSIVKAALAGEIPDPPINTLIKHEPVDGGRPIKYSVEANRADKLDRRAERPCACGGTLFDWGAGFSEGFDFVNWRCNACPDVFTEYLSKGGLVKLRQPNQPANLAGEP